MPRSAAAIAAEKELSDHLGLLYSDIHFVRTSEEQRYKVSYWTWAWAAVSFGLVLLLLLLGSAFVHQDNVIATLQRSARDCSGTLELCCKPGTYCAQETPPVPTAPRITVSIRHADGPDVLEIDLPSFDPLVSPYTVITWAKGADDTLLLTIVNPKRHAQHVINGVDCNSSNCVLPYALRVLLGSGNPATPVGTAEERAVAESADLLE